MRGPFSRRKEEVREMLLLELQKTASGLTEELRSALARNGLEVSVTTVERELRALSKAGLVERSTYVRLTAIGYQAAAEIAKRR
jgi:Mn-dependent DtxR family transcriptional regulator